MQDISQIVDVDREIVLDAAGSVARPRRIEIVDDPPLEVSNKLAATAAPDNARRNKFPPVAAGGYTPRRYGFRLSHRFAELLNGLSHARHPCREIVRTHGRADTEVGIECEKPWLGKGGQL